MKPWTDVVRPHEDILSGDLEMAMFAADLGAVIDPRGSVREVYRDPVAFFRATYLTSSMRGLVTDVLGALAGEGGDRVLQLRTPFGGGKTHTLLALYHLATGRDRLASFSELVDLPDPGPTRVAVLSGVDLDPSSPRSHDGVVARTMWGELAWQLGGAEAYRLVAPQDENRQAPGKDVLAALFPQDEPTLLLLDEVLVYVEKAKALAVGDSTLGSQVLLFLQALTELVGSHSRAAMVYSLQKSVLEAAGDESLLLALDHLVARVDAKREPVSGDEVMRVVQRRLFADLGSEEERLEIARGYADMYGRYRRQLADTDDQRKEADREAERFAERVLASYPFHPALLDLMHQRWTTLPSYQRTRGALQFLATVVHALWHGEHETLPLIAPGDVAFEDEKVRGAFFSQVGDREGFTGVLERDLIGANAGVRDIDRRLGGDSHRLTRLRIGTRVASAVLLYSFGGRTDEERGVLESELVGGLLGGDLDRNILTTALADLRDELLFLHASNRRYRFDKTPNLNQLLVNEAEKVTGEEITETIRKELERRIGASDDALLWPRDGAQIPDREPRFRVAYLDLSWALMSPEERQARLKELFEKRGAGTPRTYRNAVAFALPGSDAIDHARQAARRMLAAQALVRQAKSLNIEGEQLTELKQRGESAERDLGATLDRTYERVVVPVARDALEGPYGFEEIDLSARIGLGRLVHDRVMEGLVSHVFDTITPGKLASLLNVGDREGQRAYVACDELVDAAFSFLQFPKLRSATALRDAVARGVSAGVFGYAATAREVEGGLDAAGGPVTVGRPIGSEEIDLSAGAFVIAPAYAQELAGPVMKSEIGGGQEPGVVVPGHEGAETGAGVDGKLPVRSAVSGRRLTVQLRVGKTEVFDAVRILPALSDQADTLDVEMTIHAVASEAFDQTWVRNAIREPLEEAGIEARVDLSGDEGE